MATRKIVPRGDNEGGIGTALKKWASGWIISLTVTTINALTLAAAAVGFTISGGTTSKTLTVDETVAMSEKAAKTHGALHLPNAADPIGLPKFSAHKNGTDQTGVVTVTLTKVTFTTEEYDVGSAYDAANSKWIPGIVGKGCISTNILWASALDQDHIEVMVYKNGAGYKKAARKASGTDAVSIGMSCDVSIDAVTDYFEIYCYQTSGANKVIAGYVEHTWFMGHMLP